MRQIQESAVNLRDFAGLFFALAAIALAAILLFDFSQKQEDAHERIDHSRSVYIDSQHLLVSCEQANTSVRNWVMTKNNKYLERYQATKLSLEKETAALTSTTRTPGIQVLLRERLAPDLKTFLSACDQLASPASLAAVTVGLERQEAAEAAFKQSLQAVRQAQSNVLQARQEKMLNLSDRIEQTRTMILFSAFIAILISIFTLRTVRKKDQQKIESLQAAVKSTQEAQEAASEALDQARKSNELKSQFMANISHEIRTPMTGILGMADLLCAQDLNQPEKQYAQVLLQSSKELLTVLNDLLNFSQLQQNNLLVERKPFAIRQTIKDVTSMAESEAREKHLHLNAVVDTSIPPVIIGDEEKIRRVIATLVSNSLKFTSEGGVQISVEPTPDKSIKVAVIDTGIGIKSDDLSKIFLPFYQVDGGIRRKQGGTGLSLTIAKHIVEMMSGSIGVLSQPGAGSIFWFTFAGEVEND